MTNIALPVDQARAQGLIGASDAAAALGLDRYRAPLALWRQLRGQATNDERPAFVQEAAEWGQALEPIIRGKYVLGTPNVGVFVPTESLIKEGWLRATPDGIVVKAHPDMEFADEVIGATHALTKRDEWAQNAVAVARKLNMAGLLQVKTCSAYKADEWEDRVPTEYEIQVRVEMAVTELPWCDVVCLVGGQQFRGPFRVERNLELEANILRDLHAFHDLVQSGKEPEVDGSAAWKEYASSRMRATPVVLDADENTEALIANWLTARSSRKAIEEQEEVYKNRLMLTMSAAAATRVRSRHGLVTAYKTGGRTDWKGYALSLGGSTKPPEAYTKPSTTWALKAPKDDE